jgi:ribosomal protein S27E/very-short-patch-repair endonuclease
MERNFKQEIFLDNLPHGGKKNISNKRINWEKSIGYKVKFIYDDIEGWIEIINYNKKTRRLSIKYNKNIMDIGTGNFQNCQLGKMLNKITKEFKIEIGTRLKDEKRDITIINRKKIPIYDEEGNIKYFNKYYKYKCNICGFDGCKHYNTKDSSYKEEFWVKESHLFGKKSVGCACCANSAIVKGINDIATTHPCLVKHFVNIEDAYNHSYGSSDKILVKCPNCGCKKEMKIFDVANFKFSCSKCGDGIKYPNKYGFNLLEQLNLKFICEYSPKWCNYFFKNKIRQGIYDFYFILNNKEYILEMDGHFHNRDNYMSGQTAEESKYIDGEKDRLANEHGIKVIRIDCNYTDITKRFEYIKNSILNNDIMKILFDLNKINWLNVEQFLLNTRVKEVCNLWNSGIKNVTDITVITKLSSSAVRSYLKNGLELGWNDYNPKEESRKSAEKNNKLKQKPLKCTTINKVYESITDCSKKSFIDFGINISQSSIGKSCRTNIPFKGYEFKYITKEEYSILKEVI